MRRSELAGQNPMGWRGTSSSPNPTHPPEQGTARIAAKFRQGVEPRARARTGLRSRLKTRARRPARAGRKRRPILPSESVGGGPQGTGPQNQRAVTLNNLLKLLVSPAGFEPTAPRLGIWNYDYPRPVRDRHWDTLYLALTAVYNF